MTVQGPGSTPPLPPVALPQAASQANAARSARPSAPASAAEPASLWEMLTPEERAFFQQLATLGPLHYGPGGRTEEKHASAPTGQRIDVRA
jgi:hypothetical protein